MALRGDGGTDWIMVQLWNGPRALSILLSQKKIDDLCSMVGGSPPVQAARLSFLGLRLGKCPLPRLRNVKVKSAAPQAAVST